MPLDIMDTPVNSAVSLVNKKQLSDQPFDHIKLIKPPSEKLKINFKEKTDKMNILEEIEGILMKNRRIED